MKQYTDLEYLKLSKGQRLLYRIASFFCAIPGKIGGLFVGLWNLIKNAATAIGKEASDIWTTFVHGDWKTKLSYLVMGFGNLARGQILRGLLFLLAATGSACCPALARWVPPKSTTSSLIPT